MVQSRFIIKDNQKCLRTNRLRLDLPADIAKEVTMFASPAYFCRYTNCNFLTVMCCEAKGMSYGILVGLLFPLHQYLTYILYILKSIDHI